MSWFNMPWRPEDSALVEKWKGERGKHVKLVDETIADPDADAISYILGFPITKQINNPLFDIPYVKEEKKRKQRIPLTEKERLVVFETRGRKCEDCGKDHDLQIHHLDGDPANNAITNLMVACYTCHKERDRKLRKEAVVTVESGRTVSELAAEKIKPRDGWIDLIIHELERGEDLEILRRNILVKTNYSISGVNNLINEARFKLEARRERERRLD